MPVPQNCGHMIAQNVAEEMKTMAKLKAENYLRIRGVTGLARTLGVSPSHLTRVIRGIRPARGRLARQLARLGIHPITNAEG